MTGWMDDQDLDDLQVHALALRRHLAAAAASVAGTEDQIADTLDRIALTRPQDALRLRARAAEARRYADIERERAARYGAPSPVRKA